MSRKRILSRVVSLLCLTRSPVFSSANRRPHPVSPCWFSHTHPVGRPTHPTLEPICTASLLLAHSKGGLSCVRIEFFWVGRLLRLSWCRVLLGADRLYESWTYILRGLGRFWSSCRLRAVLVNPSAEDDETFSLKAKDASSESVGVFVYTPSA